MAKTFTPTEEQQNAVHLARSGRNISIQALAGAGKTTTLGLVADALPSKTCAYMAFNKKIVEDAKRSFPGNVRCSTAHGMAMGAVGYDWCVERLEATGRMRNKVMAERLGLDADSVVPFGDGAETIELASSAVAGIAHRAVGQFCMTDDDVIGRRHVPFQRGIDKPGSGYENNSALREIVVPLARQMWSDLSNRNRMTWFRFTPSHYLKMWQLSEPRIKKDVILFDEAQDANPVMMSVVEAQHHAQKIWVGDTNQTIYGWNGAVNAMELAATDATAYLTESFRFGPEIAEQANIVLDRLGAPNVIGAGPAGSVEFIERPDVFLGRTNAEVVARALAEMAEGRKVCVQGGTDEIIRFAKAALMLMDGVRVDHPELMCFKNWGEVEEYAGSDDGADLRLLVRIVNDFGAQDVIDGLQRAVDPKNADVTISTAHKSKGAEWATVALLGDFPEGEDVKDPELRLLYVAATRAMTGLDRTLADLEGIDFDYLEMSDVL